MQNDIFVDHLSMFFILDYHPSFLIETKLERNKR